MKIDKAIRLKDVDTFVQQYGRGDLGLSENHKKARIEKYLGKPIDVSKPWNGATKGQSFTKGENGDIVDTIQPDILANIQSYPSDSRFSGTHKIINIEVFDDGSMDVDHIVLNGKENDVKERTLTGIHFFSDDHCARNNKINFSKGKLKEVSDRTMSIMRDKNELNDILDDDAIDTDEDKPEQM